MLIVPFYALIVSYAWWLKHVERKRQRKISQAYIDACNASFDYQQKRYEEDRAGRIGQLKGMP